MIVIPGSVSCLMGAFEVFILSERFFHDPMSVPVLEIRSFYFLCFIYFRLLLRFYEPAF